MYINLFRGRSGLGELELDPDPGGQLGAPGGVQDLGLARPLGPGRSSEADWSVCTSTLRRGMPEGPGVPLFILVLKQ